MVKNKLLYATIAAMLMGLYLQAVLILIITIQQQRARALYHSRNLPQVRIQIYQSNYMMKIRYHHGMIHQLHILHLEARLVLIVHRLKYQVQQLQSLKQEHMLYQEM